MKADELLSALFSNYYNRNDLRNIVRIHNSALKSQSINDSLLSLWSILESLVKVDGLIRKQSTDSEKNSEGERYKSENVTEMLIPFLKSTYICKLVQTLMADIKHWNQDFFDTYIASIGFGKNEIEKTFAFLSFTSTQPAREELFSRTEQYPLLRNRVLILNEQFHNSKRLKACISEHEKRIRWHIQRIYRARNYIIHDGTCDDKMNYDLLINLHSYVDTIVSKIVDLINISPYNDTVQEIITEHSIEVSIFDEMLENQTTEEVCESNALRYLYYNYHL